MKYENKTISKMKEWTQSSNEHLRRLASEGCRPRLPWAIALNKYKKDPSLVFEIIELLKNDTSKYVQKSVANNLNDISKDNPHLVIKFVKENLGQTKELDWICKHASRTLLKAGNENILKLFGYEDINHINIIHFKYDKQLFLGEELNFSFELTSDKSLGNIRVEYQISYLKANNIYSKKSFMIFQSKLKEQNKKFEKKQRFKNMTTRKHYLGKHYISILINGKEIKKGEFILK